jgi:hypothetical protein
LETATCHKCAAPGAPGESYRFYHGKVLAVKQRVTDVDSTGVQVTTTARYNIECSQDLFICHRCLLSEVARSTRSNALATGLVGLFGLVFCTLLIAEHSWWWLVGVVLCLLFLALPVLTIQDLVKLKGSLAKSDPAELAKLVADQPGAQNLGDQCAAELRKAELMKSGFDLFLTRQAHQLVTTQENVDILAFQESGPLRRTLAWVFAGVALAAASVGIGIAMMYLTERGGVGPVLWFLAVMVPPIVALMVFGAIRWIH